jgi:integrase/recombinase XerD
VSDGTFQSYVTNFLLSREAAGRSPATLDFYRFVLGRLGDFCPDWPPQPGLLRNFFVALRRDGLSLYTLVSYDGALRVFFDWCAVEGLLASSPMARLIRPEKPKRIPRAIPKAVLARLFRTMERQAGNLLAMRDHALFRLIYDCGLRASEACNARVADLDIAENAITVKGKGRHERVVFFGSETRQALARWLAVLHPGSEWIFPSVQVHQGLRQLTPNGVNQALHRWCDRAGIERFRVHDLRHSYARHALRAGIDAEMVSSQLGHHDPGFTLTVYGRSEDRDRREVHLRLSPGDHLE